MRRIDRIATSMKQQNSHAVSFVRDRDNFLGQSRHSSFQNSSVDIISFLRNLYNSYITHRPTLIGLFRSEWPIFQKENKIPSFDIFFFFCETRNIKF